MPDRGLYCEIKEARSDNFDSVKQLLLMSKIVDDNLSNVVRSQLLGRCERHSNRRGEVSPFRPFGSVQTQLRPGFCLQLAFFFGPIECSEERAGDLFLHNPAGQERTPKSLAMKGKTNWSL